MQRLGATPVAMTLADVLPALQQGAIDGAVAGLGPFVACISRMRPNTLSRPISQASSWFWKSAKNGTTGCQRTCGRLLIKMADRSLLAINPLALKMYGNQRKAWVANGGELISLPADEQATMMKILSSVGEDVSRSRPGLHEAFEIVADAARRTHLTPS